MRRIKNFIFWSTKEKVLWAEAICMLFLAKALLILLPFKHCLNFIRIKNFDSIDLDESKLESIKKALDRANYFAIWNNKCLVSSFAGRWMLSRRDIPSEMVIGVKKGRKQSIEAHAWLHVNDFEIVEKTDEYVVMQRW